MRRIIFKKGKQKLFIESVLKGSGYSLTKLSEKFKFCSRSFNNWFHEKYSMPYDLVEKLSKLIKIKISSGIKIVPRYWYTIKAGKQGGKRYVEIYGSPGTPEGRKLGGKRSIITHKKWKTNFFRLKEIVFPTKTEDLAELFGIVLGDGGISKYQLCITLNRHSDYNYHLFVKKLIQKLFNIKCSVIDKGNCVIIVVNSVRLVGFLVSNELKVGNKVIHQIDVPKWIKKNNNFSKGCLRGLVDTDGCIYFERHKYKNKLYKNICLNFSNRSVPLLKFVSDFLNRYNIKNKLNKYSVKIGRLGDVKKYFNLIGSSNKKHLDKYRSNLTLGWTQSISESRSRILGGRSKLSEGGPPLPHLK